MAAPRHPKPERENDARDERERRRKARAAAAKSMHPGVTIDDEDLPLNQPPREDEA